MSRWLVVLVVGCGSGRTHDSTLVLDDPPRPVEPDAAPATPASGSGKPEAAITANLTVEEACARFDKLADQGCDWTQRFPPEFRDPGSCVPSLQTWVNDPKLQKGINCWALECDAAAACMVSTHSESAPPGARACGEQGTGPVLADAATWASRPGANARKFSDVKTTVERPVEVCGIQGEVEWMTAVTCNDGSHPYGTGTAGQAKVNDSRDAWVQHGGRCNSILDRFTVKCPEATYTIHVDRYVCPQR